MTEGQYWMISKCSLDFPVMKMTLKMVTLLVVGMWEEGITAWRVGCRWFPLVPTEAG